MAAGLELVTEATLGSVWADVSGRTIADDLLEWIPDAFALTETLLQRSEAYRFAVSPPAGHRWPPLVVPGWPEAVADAADHWSAWVVDQSRALPPLVAMAWRVV
ncbi:MAG TPA: hypothetical protein VM386_02435, partial [Acidimicrobiales bacterium]|nr:hypothetical protein [Acidimicrobiales bacterium]